MSVHSFFAFEDVESAMINEQQKNDKAAKGKNSNTIKYDQYNILLNCFRTFYCIFQ